MICQQKQNIRSNYVDLLAIENISPDLFNLMKRKNSQYYKREIHIYDTTCTRNEGTCSKHNIEWKYRKDNFKISFKILSLWLNVLNRYSGAHTHTPIIFNQFNEEYNFKWIVNIYAENKKKIPTTT